MKKVTKYILGAGALFALGFGACYALTGDVKGLWNTTKYVAYKTERAMIAFSDTISEKTTPEPVKTMDALMIEGIYGMTKEEAEQKHKEVISELDDKIKQCKEKK